MKNMFKKLTALLTAGAALCSMLPLGTAAYSYRVYTRGTFAVLWSKEDYTLLRGLKLEHNNMDAAGYLLATDELLDTLPEGSPPVKRGDILRVPETAAISGSINDHPFDVMGYNVRGIIEVDEDGDPIYISGESEIIAVPVLPVRRTGGGQGNELVKTGRHGVPEAADHLRQPETARQSESYPIPGILRGGLGCGLG